MAAAAQSFYRMTEAELRQWVDTNPIHVNDWDRDYDGITPLYAAVHHIKSLSLVLWLLDEKGADVNKKIYNGQTPLHGTCSLDILNALLDRGADSTLLDNKFQSSIMTHAYNDNDEVSIEERMLEDLRARATIDMQDKDNGTAIHYACNREDETSATSIVHLLLQAGAYPTLTNEDGDMPLDLLRLLNPTYTTTIALLEGALTEVEKTWLLVKARRFIVAARSNFIPPHLQDRVARGQPFPQLALASVTGANKSTKERRRNSHK